MIVDALAYVVALIFGAVVSALPAAGSHTWLSVLDPSSSLVVGAFAFDSLVPLHELVAVLALIVGLSVPAFAFRIAFFIYKRIPVIGH